MEERFLSNYWSTTDDRRNALKLNCFEKEKRHQEISLLIGDIKRLKLYPKFGWLMSEEISDSVEQAYEALKDMGYTDYLYSEEEQRKLIEDHQNNKS